MLNSSKIEKATRDHVGATLTNEQINELVKISDPSNTKGVYPSDCAYSRNAEGKLVPRGKTAYGDGVLEYLGENSFKVLSDKDIVRRPTSKKAVAPAPPTPEADKKKAVAATLSKPVVATKQKARVKAAVQ